MAAPATPTGFFVTQGQGNVYAQCALTPTATSYIFQRSTDGVTFSTVATQSTPYFLDTTVALSTQYYYTVEASNISGTSAPTAAQVIIPTPTGELCLGQIRLMSQQRADRVNSNFVTLAEWNTFINQAMFELYDLMVMVDEDYNIASPTLFTTDGVTYLFPLPNGSNTFQNSSGANFIPPAFYKLKGVDLAVNNAVNAYVTLERFNFIDRNKYLYPNSSSTIYGVFNSQYKLLGSNIELIPTPSANQIIRLWYVPRLPTLLADTDTTTIGISGWLQYVIIRAAKYALDKEEADTSTLTEEIAYLKQRIEDAAQNRDIGQPQTISDTRNWNGGGNSGGWGFGPWGGN